MTDNPKIKVGILGATGAVGQRFAQLIADHPYFEIAALTASDRSVGKRYADACKWLLRGGMPPALADRVVVPTEAAAIPSDVRLLFSALPSGNAGSGRGGAGRGRLRRLLERGGAPDGSRRAAADP